LNKIAEAADSVTLESASEVFRKLVRCLAVDICGERRVPQREFTAEALTLMRALPWRQNLGDLRDMITRLMTTGHVGEVRLEELLEHVRIESEVASPAILGTSPRTLRAARLQFEREYIREVLERHGWRMSDAARTLGIQRPNLYRKARQLGILRAAMRTR
jgi:two-component system nitrogen regulation response regulator NtrX